MNEAWHGIWDCFEAAVAAAPDKVGVIDGDVRLTYRQLRKRAASLALALRVLGVGEGDRVAMLDRNSAEYIETYFAAAGLGVILCPLNTRLAPVEQAAVLTDAGAKVLIARGDQAPAVAAVLERGSPVSRVVWIDPSAEPIPSVAADDYEALLARHSGPFEPAADDPDRVAHLYYTSGTTGRPKGVMLTHRNVRTHATAAAEELELTANDVWGHVAPMFHLADAWAVFAITAVAGTHVVVPRFVPDLVLDSLALHGVTLTNLIPTMLNLVAERQRTIPRNCRSLRLLLSGGAPIAPRVVRAVLEVFGCDYMQTYGLTETSPYLTLGKLPPHLAALPFEERLVWKSKTGRPFGPAELRVVDDSGRDVPADGKTVGEILARGPTVTPGYWQRPEETAAAFCDGWLRTGDLAVIDSEGFLDIVDRHKDVIVTGGENVYSTEVEAALYDHPAVLEAAVFALPDETWGETVAAAVVLRPGLAATAGELSDWCRARLAGYKIPRRVFFVDALPRTGSGKIAKRLLREQRP
ncbi:MAG TPA: long-chain-fatty-acid--CoA ligase [Polyangia bacterium]|nr:long-chain-fatty-acid--CoA ligase [Polyangia bacterium]